VAQAAAEGVTTAAEGVAAAFRWVPAAGRAPGRQEVAAEAVAARRWEAASFRWSYRNWSNRGRG